MGRHLLTPVPAFDDLGELNRRLLDRRGAYSGTPHYEKGASRGELFERDRAALLPLPERPFACVRYGSAAVDKRGCASVDGGRRYHVSDAMAGRTATVACGAATVAFANAAGEVLAERPRRFGSAPSPPSPASRATRPGAWRASPAGTPGRATTAPSRTSWGARPAPRRPHWRRPPSRRRKIGRAHV